MPPPNVVAAVPVNYPSGEAKGDTGVDTEYVRARGKYTTFQQHLDTARLFHITHPKHVDYSWNALESDWAIKQLIESWSHVESLVLTGNPLGTVGARVVGTHAQHLSCLRELNLRGCQLGPDGTRLVLDGIIEHSHGLQVLCLAHNVQGVVHESTPEFGRRLGLLVRAAPVHSLDIQGNCMGPPEIEALSQALLSQPQPQLRDLNLRNNRCGDYGTRHLAVVLSSPRCSITTLNLAANTISELGIRHLSESLKTNKSLQELDLSHNPIELSGLVTLTKAIMSNPSSQLRSLKINACQLGMQGLRALAPFLASPNVHLQELSYDGNCSTMDPALFERDATPDSLATHALAQALSRSASLRSLSLRDNRLCNQHAIDLGQALERNSSLTSLYLSYNLLGDAGMQALQRAASVNGVATTVELQGNPGDVTVQDRVMELFQVNAVLTDTIKDDIVQHTHSVFHHTHVDNHSSEHGRPETMDANPTVTSDATTTTTTTTTTTIPTPTMDLVTLGTVQVSHTKAQNAILHVLYEHLSQVVIRGQELDPAVRTAVLAALRHVVHIPRAHANHPLHIRILDLCARPYLNDQERSAFAVPLLSAFARTTPARIPASPIYTLYPDIVALICTMTWGQYLLGSSSSSSSSDKV